MKKRPYYYRIVLYIAIAIVGIICSKLIKKVNAPLTFSHDERILTNEVSEKINGIDPAYSGSLARSEAIAKIYEGFLEYHYLKRPAELIPNLAATMPEISEDGCVYTFTIKEGIFFQDDICFPHGKGRELVAEDFIYSIKRIADPKTQASHFSLIENRIQGLDAWRQKYRDSTEHNYNEIIEGIKSLNRYTLQFTLNKPYPQFLYILAMPFLYVVPKEAVNNYGNMFSRHPVGTGPFMLKQFCETKIVFTKNPNFRDKRFPNEAAPAYQHMLAYAGYKLPLVDKVVTYFMEEYPSWLAFQRGNLDLLCVHNKTIASKIISHGILIPQLKNKKVKLFCASGSNSFYFAFNNKDNLLGYNKKLRQAMLMAFDSTSYNNIFFCGMAAVTHTFLPPTIPGYQQDAAISCRYNLIKAKQYLAEAGYPSGKGLPVITLRTKAGISLRHQAEYFARCMKRIGIQVKIITCATWHEFSKTNTMMSAFQWCTEYPDAQSFFSLLYPEVDFYYGVGLHFVHDEFNKTYQQASLVQDLPKRITLYHKLNQIINDAIPMIYALHASSQVLYQMWVKNYIYNTYIFGIEQYIAIDPYLKKHCIKN